MLTQSLHFIFFSFDLNDGFIIKKSVLQTSAHFGMKHFSSSYLTTLTSQSEIDAEIQSALQVLKDGRCNYIIGAFYPKWLSIIMGIAYDMGMAGPGKFWLISGTASTAPFTLSGQFIVPKGESVHFISLYTKIWNSDVRLCCRIFRSKSNGREWNYVL